MRTGEKERRELKVTSYLGNSALNPTTISLGEYIYASLLVFKYYFLGLCKVYYIYSACLCFEVQYMCSALV